MKILIGTPIHISKDYAMERWLKNVAELQQQTQTDLLMVDNSSGLNYVEKVKGYCAKYKIVNYKIEHIELNQEKLSSDMRINVAQETIRRRILASDYDAWFSWECDQLIPNNALNELIRLMGMVNCKMGLLNCWARWNNNLPMTDMGCTLIKKECLEKACFLPDRNGEISLDESDRFRSVFKARVLSDGHSYIEAFGVIQPIYHLNE